MSTPRTDASSTARDWVVGRHAAGSPALRVVCFPPAGSGAMAYSAWRPHLPEGMEMLPVELPGHGTRLAEPLAESLADLVDGVLDSLDGALHAPYALFGHSFGGLLAYETALQAARRGLPGPRAVLLSSARPPDVTPSVRWHLLDDAGLLEWLRVTGGMPEALLRHRDYVTRALAMIRADLVLAETYRRPSPERLACPLHVFAATDDPVTDAGLPAGWEVCAGGEFTVTWYPGGHFHLFEDPAPLLADLASLLLAG